MKDPRTVRRLLAMRIYEKPDLCTAMELWGRKHCHRRAGQMKSAHGVGCTQPVNRVVADTRRGGRSAPRGDGHGRSARATDHQSKCAKGETPKKHDGPPNESRPAATSVEQAQELQRLR